MEIVWDFDIKYFLIFIIFIVLIFVVLLIKSWLAKSDLSSDINKQLVLSQWKKIEELLNFGKEMNYKLAVIEADKLLDYVLKGNYFPGNTMAERLKIATYKFPRLREVWWAHKVRNHVVHDTQYILKFNETRKIISLFGKALKELKAL